MRRAFWWIVLGLVVADQLSKWLVQLYLPLHIAHTVIPETLYFTHVLNDGSAFGQFRGHGRFLTLAALLAAGAILYFRRRILTRGEPTSLMLLLGLALPLAGAAGNTIDRVRIGRVIDFIEVGRIGFDFSWFPVFNIADIAISLGSAAILIHFIFLDKPETTALKPQDAASGAAAATPAEGQACIRN